MPKKTITFNELRKIKDNLPDGAMSRIAEELGLRVDTVRNYFGGEHYNSGRSIGVHIEPGPDGGIVELDDTTILEKALAMITPMDEDEPSQE
ncbi:MAG: DNA-binding protein [Porphyromonas sp.]|nr:DNA-binding protein [Porphyromonas sp.]